MFATLFTGIGAKIIGVVVALGILGGAYAWITTGAYNRGYAKGEADVTARMTKVIEAQRKVATENADKWHATPPSERINELRRRCVAACEGEAKCVAACQ